MVLLFSNTTWVIALKIDSENITVIFPLVNHYMDVIWSYKR